MAVKYREHSLLMRFNKTDPQLAMIRNSTCGKLHALQSLCECDHTDESH